MLLASLASRLTLGHASELLMVIAPLGASAVLLFALPASPLAQPWPFIGGNLVSAAIGVTFARWIDDPMLAATLAIAAAIAMMFALRCLHPPGGAIALTAALGGPSIKAMGYGFVLSAVALHSLLLLLTAIVFNNATRRRYPHRPQVGHANVHRTADARPTDRLGFVPQDLDEALAQYNQVLDISRGDLEMLFLQTEMQAYRRRFGEIMCGDIMSRDVVAVEAGTALGQAWTLLDKHRINALPVIDQARRVVGIVTLADFMRHARLDWNKSFQSRWRGLLRRIAFLPSGKPKLVGQIMSFPAKTVGLDLHIVQLVPLLSDHGLHHLPVVDREGRLAGMLTQSDLIAALYRARLEDGAAPAQPDDANAGTGAVVVPLIPKHGAPLAAVGGAAHRRRMMQGGLRHSER